jgi:hypothetical protein
MIVDNNFTRQYNPEDSSELKMVVFWNFAPCSLVDVDRRFGGTYYLHHQGDRFIDNTAHHPP